MLRKLFLAVCFSISVSTFASPLQDALKDYGIQFKGAETYQLLKNQKLSGSKNQHILEAESPKKERIEIRIISPVDEAAAQAMIDSEQTVVKKLYAAPQTPYMGDIAQAIGSCPTQFGPLRTQIHFLSQSHEALIGAANADHAFGACSTESAKFRGSHLAYYDARSKTIWSWRVFSPWTDKKPLGKEWLANFLSKLTVTPNLP